MSKRRRFTLNLLGIGHIAQELHYGVFARSWWEPVSLELENKTKVLTVPFRLYMRINCNLNGKDFTITVVQNNKNKYKPGFLCTCENISSEIESYPSTAINTCYKKVFGTKTEYSGVAVMGFENENIVQQLLEKVEFCPIFLRIEKFLVVISDLGYSSNDSNDGYYGAGIGFVSSFITRYRDAQHLFLLKLEDNQCLLEIYLDSNKIRQFTGFTPDDVWKKVGIHTKFSGSYIFGITHESIQQLLQSKDNKLVTCKPEEWNNNEILMKVYNRHIKTCKIPNTMINWPSLFHDWYKQHSTIVQFPLVLAKIYPDGYELQDKELRAWRAMFQACGCSNITPFLHVESQVEFWSRAYDDKADKQILNNLYKANLLQIDNENFVSISLPTTTQQAQIFWKSFQDAISSNKRGQDGKIRILSIIALNFKYTDLIQELSVSKYSI